MTSEAARHLIKDTFERPFDKDRFRKFTINLLNRLDPAPFTYRGNYIFADFRDRIESLERIGKYEDSDGKRLDVLVVHLKRDTSLERARATQRKFVAKYLDGSRGNEYKDAALVAFVSPTEADWRFSFIKMEYKLGTTAKGKPRVTSEFTPARRYSFLVGENESSHTAQSRLLPILAELDNDPTLAELESAFSVERVTKEFFERYRELFLEVKEALDKLVKSDKAIQADFEEKGVDPVDFSKKLLGQIVFLYFLQKKGWFGLARNAAWGSGPKNFLRRLFSGEIVAYDNFFNGVLESLFYEALASGDRDADWYSEFKCKIPFLNGGLFDPINGYDWVHTDILLPNELFSNHQKTKQGDTGTGILDVFDRYNFTVKEDEPLEREVAVDPEMLGKVFENLLEVKDRKSKGTYYTPREIVHYMCQESLINHLATELDGDVPREDIITLIKHGESALENDVRVMQQGGHETDRYYYKLPDSIRTHVKAIDDRLAEIKVCDPAVGSGAFLVGMMSEIIRSRQVLTEFLDNAERRTVYDLKRHAIQNSLHGVDIDPSAVEIAKLRLWLSLVVDEDNYKKIQPLPNLDYKIMQGNSLLETYEGIELIDRQFLVKQEDKIEQRERLTSRLLALQRELLGLHENDKLSSTERARIMRETKTLNDALAALEEPPEDERNVPIWGKTEPQVKAERLLQLHREFFAAYHKREKERLHNEIESLTWDLIETTLRQQMKTKALDDIRKFQRTNTRPFFVWRLYFADVFRRKDGFDVVIANPPYVRHETISNIAPELRKRYSVAASRADLLIYFYEQGVNLLHSGGVLTLITSNKFHRAAYGSKLRPFLTSNLQINVLIDFGDAPVFEAIAYASILIGKKGVADGKHRVRAYNWRREDDFSTIPQTLAREGIQLAQDSLAPSGWHLESPAAIQLLEKLRKIGTPLNDFVRGKFYYGIKTGFNKAFVLSREQRDQLVQEDRKSAQLIKPYLRGRDVKRWAVHPQDLYLIVFPYGFHSELEDYPAIHRHLTRYRTQLKERGQCKSSRGNKQGGQHHWLELDNNPKPEYLDSFAVEKVVMPAIERGPAFAVDQEGHYSNDKTNICIADSPHALCAILNSRLLWWMLTRIAATKQNGYYEFKPLYIRQLSIPPMTDADSEVLTRLANRAASLTTKGDNVGIAQIEKEIDDIIYRLFNLTADEIAQIETATSIPTGQGDAVSK